METEVIATIEVKITIDTTIADQVQDTLTEVTQDNNHHIIGIIIIATITDKDTTVEILTETIDTDNVLVVIIDITIKIIETTEEIRPKENKIIDTTLKNEEVTEKSTIIIIIIILIKTEYIM